LTRKKRKETGFWAKSEAFPLPDVVKGEFVINGAREEAARIVVVRVFTLFARNNSWKGSASVTRRHIAQPAKARTRMYGRAHAAVVAPASALPAAPRPRKCYMKASRAKVAGGTEGPLIIERAN